MIQLKWARKDDYCLSIHKSTTSVIVFRSVYAFRFAVCCALVQGDIAHKKNLFFFCSSILFHNTKHRL